VRLPPFVMTTPRRRERRIQTRRRRVAIPAASCVLLSDNNEEEEVPLVQWRGRHSLGTPASVDIPTGTTTEAPITGGMSMETAAADAAAVLEVPPACAGVDSSAGAEPSAMETGVEAPAATVRVVEEVPAAPRVLPAPAPPITAADEDSVAAPADALGVPEDIPEGPPVAMEVDTPPAPLSRIVAVNAEVSAPASAGAQPWRICRWSGGRLCRPRR